MQPCHLILENLWGYIVFSKYIFTFFFLCVCVFSSAEAYRHYSQLTLQSSYQPSHQTQAHLVMLSGRAMRQERKLARQPAPSSLSSSPSRPSLCLLSMPMVYSLPLPLTASSSLLPSSRLACTIRGSQLQECGGMERDW